MNQNVAGPRGTASLRYDKGSGTVPNATAAAAVALARVGREEDTVPVVPMAAVLGVRIDMA